MRNRGGVLDGELGVVVRRDGCGELGMEVWGERVVFGEVGFECRCRYAARFGVIGGVARGTDEEAEGGVESKSVREEALRESGIWGTRLDTCLML